MTRKISERAIRAMPYESRVRRYEQEKDMLFNKLSNLSAEEIRQRHDELVRKWMI